MDTFPAFFPLSGRTVVIAGEGEAARVKARLFEGSPARIVRLEGQAALDKDAYQGAALIFVASYDETFARDAARAARASGAPLNVVDRPELSDFHTPAIIDRGQVVAAIGTAGSAPLLASLLRAEVEARVAPGVGAIASLLGDQREALRRAFPDLVARRGFLRAVLAGPAADAAAAGDVALARRLLIGAIEKGWSAVGLVSLIEAPIAPDLLSLRAMRAMNVADVVVAGEGADDLITRHARRDAEWMTLAAATPSTLEEGARAGRLIAIVAAQPGHALASALEARGVVVHRLRAALPT